MWPWPGRIFAAGPSHTVMDLANAINYASEFEFMFVLGDAWTDAWSGRQRSTRWSSG
ncbi:MAG: hypothetical protein PVSMB10_09680 [Pseudarthrobacter sp.]